MPAPTPAAGHVSAGAAEPSRDAGESGGCRSADGGELRDDLVDALMLQFRRLRSAIVRPPQAEVPVPSLGRPLELAKLFACGAVADLSRDEHPVTVKDVAAALHLEHSTVSRLLGELAAEGLVRRGVDSSDRRRTTIALTDVGRAAVEDGRRLSHFIYRTILHDWTEPDVTTLARLLTALADSATARIPGLQELAREHICGSATEAPRR